MSVVGTGVAAAVAQTALQAQQVAARRDRQSSRTTADAKQLRDLFDSRLKALEEADASEAGAQLHVDGQLPDRPAPQQEPQQKDHEPAEPDGADVGTQAPGYDPARPDSAGAGFYRHLDVEG